MDYMVAAATTLCGHMFCERCIFEWLLFNKDCPVCRQTVRNEPPHNCSVMDGVVELYLTQKKLEKEKKNYEEKREKHIKWKGERTYYTQRN